MDLQLYLKSAAGLLALGMYLPLILAVVRQQGAGQSFAMWALWAVLDWTLTISLIVQRGNFWLPAGFALGSVIMAGLLLARKRFVWRRLEWLITLLVAVCLAVWAAGGPKLATIASTAAIFAAGIPGMLELWRNPRRNLAFIWLGYTVANLLAFIGGSDWSIGERFAPAVFASQTIMLAGIGFRRHPGGIPSETPG